MIFKLALRNLLRHRWRSGLTAGGVAVATFILVWMVAYMDSFIDLMVKGATSVEVGQVQISTKAHADKANIYNSLPIESAKLDEVRAIDGVSGAAPRVTVFGLVGNEARSQVARIVGVDAHHEKLVTSLPKGVVEGDWLSDTAPEVGAREVLLGETFAKLLDVGVGDELVVFLQAADGSLGNDLLTVRGIIKSGNTAIDRNSVFMHLADVQWMAALDGRAHQVLVAVDVLAESDRLAGEVQAVVGSAPIVEDDENSALIARSWRDVVPELAQMIDVSNKSIWIMYLVIYLIAGLGILNTQRMSALERSREFGVLLAIGLTPSRLARMIMAETLLLTGIGALFGFGAGLALAQYHAVAGMDMTALTGGDGFDYMGIAFDERIYFVLNWAHLVQPLYVVLIVAILCGIWPAIASARLVAVRAIAGRN